MKVFLIGPNFEKNSGQGVSKFSGYLYENLKSLDSETKLLSIGEPKNPYAMLINNTLGAFFKTLFAKADVFHFMMPENCFPCRIKRPSVVTVYDVIPLLINERKKSYNTYFKNMIKIALKADHIVTISESTKKDMQKLFKIDDKKVSVILPGVDHSLFFPLKKNKNRVFTAGYIGGLGKRKNIQLILKTAKELEKENIIFKIAGKGPQLNQLLELKNNLNLNNVEFVGFVPENKLNDFYNSLDVFLFPSFYEGFGLPVLEAMATGTPVVTSDVSSMPEITKDAGILINPNSVGNMKIAIKKIMKSKKLQDSMRKKGIKRASEFSWRKSAEEIYKIYNNLKK